MKWLTSLRRDPSDADAANAGAVESGEVVETASCIPAPIPPESIEPPASDRSRVAQPCPPVDSTADVAAAANEAQRTTASDASSTESGAKSGDTFEKLGEVLLRRHQELLDGQKSLNELFSTRLRSDEAQARAVEKLHDELRHYKTNFIRQQLLPVLKEVIFCHDFVSAQVERLASESAGQPVSQALEATRQMLIDLLFKYDVEPYRSEGGPFDPRSQQCTHTIPTDRPDADKTVAARGLPGFRGPEGIVRREQVSVYKFTPGAD